MMPVRVLHVYPPTASCVPPHPLLRTSRRQKCALSGLQISQEAERRACVCRTCNHSGCSCHHVLTSPSSPLAPHLELEQVGGRVEKGSSRLFRLPRALEHERPTVACGRGATSRAIDDAGPCVARRPAYGELCTAIPLTSNFSPSKMRPIWPANQPGG